MKSKFLILTFSLLLTVNAVVAGDNVLVMPEQLSTLCVENLSKQIESFYNNKPGPIGPPFVYGVAKGDSDKSAAFWCQRGKKNGGTISVLTFMVADSDFTSHVVGEFETISTPLGLSLYTIEEPFNQLGFFVKLTEQDQKKMPHDASFEGRGIFSFYDGVESTFVMHGGEWWLRQRH